MAHNESMEMYLETVYLLERNEGHAHVADIAKKLEVSKPSVTKAMKSLKEKGLINKEPYGSITLTVKGLELSKKIFIRHELITRFLECSLELSPAEASENACKMEHVISDAMMTSIEAYLEKYNIEVKV